MSRTLLIDPITRIEGHAKITIKLDDAGEVSEAHMHVTQVRGFEKFVEGRPFHEMPGLMARICGICPVSHLIASAKACDELMAVTIPPAASSLRQIVNLAQIAQSHALSFFYLSAPDLLLGMDAEAGSRNLFGLAEANPQLARDGVRLRQIGQTIIEILGGKRIHPDWVIAGGVSEALTPEKRAQILAMLPDGITLAQRTLNWYKTTLGGFADEIAAFANFPTMFMSLTNADESLEFYDGDMRWIAPDGGIVVDGVKPDDYDQYIGEAVEAHTYLKSPYFRPLGYPDGIYRVGPLARLSIARTAGTPLADAEMEGFRALDRNSSFHFHYARLIEILYCFEKIEALLNRPEILDEHVRAYAAPNRHSGVGVSEAPRGTLLHHYEIDDDGLISRANLIIATGHNNLAMNQGVKQVAQQYVDGSKLQEGMLNRVEAVIRCFDPCLSCASHAFGQMPMHIELRDAQGRLVDQLKRG
jgi:NAD-reducing hydrogenase large subunit